MDKDEGYRVLKKNGYTNIVAIKKNSDYSLKKHSHDFNVDLIVLAGSLEITMEKSSVVLYPGSRFKLNKNEIHAEKAGLNGVYFLSARP